MNLRADDPAAMKNFVMSVQNRANELKASSGNGQPNTTGKRVGQHENIRFFSVVFPICDFLTR